MPKTKKEEKKGAVDPAKKAEAKKKTEEALRETESTTSEVEKRARNRNGRKTRLV